jgi:hypothetical protein
VFEQEKAFCGAHKDELRQKYPGKHLVIIGDQIIAAYDDVGKAYRETVTTHEPGSFMIRKVPVRPEDDIVWLSPFTYARVF